MITGKRFLSDKSVCLYRSLISMWQSCCSRSDSEIRSSIICPPDPPEICSQTCRIYLLPAYFIVPIVDSTFFQHYFKQTPNTVQTLNVLTEMTKIYISPSLRPGEMFPARIFAKQKDEAKKKKMTKFVNPQNVAVRAASATPRASWKFAFSMALTLLR